MTYPLHATGSTALDPLAVLVGALGGLVIWQGVRLLAQSDSRKRGGA